MTGRVLVCRDCGQPLEIVCPQHGATVSRVVSELHLERTAHIPRITHPRRHRTVRAGTQRARIAQVVCDRSDPTTADHVAEALGIGAERAGVELCQLAASGHIARVKRGVYAPSPGTVP